MLSRLPGVLPPDIREHFAGELKWLGNVTSPVRDFDVFLEELPRYQAELAENLDLSEFRDHLLGRRGQEQAELEENLASERYRELKAGWESFLQRDPSTWADAPDAQRPLQQVASAEIWRSYEGGLERAAAITDVSPEASPDEDFHELRKDLKKLRYLLEFFRELYPTDEIDGSIAALKSLQDILGEINDLAVQRQIVRDVVTAETGNDAVPVQHLLSFIEASLQQLRRQFSDAFVDFGSVGVRERFRRLFGAAQPTS